MARCTPPLPFALGGLVSHLQVLTTMLSFTVMWQITDLLFWHQPSPGITLDIFLFPVTTLNNILCPTTPWHSAVSIHQLDWEDTLGRIPHHSSPSCSHHTRPLKHPTPLCQWAHLQQMSTQVVEEIHHPSSTVCQHTPATLFPHPQPPPRTARASTKLVFLSLPLLPLHWFSTKCSHGSQFLQGFHHLQQIHTQALAENLTHP